MSRGSCTPLSALATGLGARSEVDPLAGTRPADRAVCRSVLRRWRRPRRGDVLAGLAFVAAADRARQPIEHELGAHRLVEEADLGLTEAVEAYRLRL